MTDVERWNARAGLLLRRLEERPREDEPSPLERAQATLRRWRALVDRVPHRALAAAAHEGLEDGPVKTAVEKHRRGCLTLAGNPGGGKTVGLAWLAYQCPGEILWLDAVDVGQAPPEQVAKRRREIETYGLVVLDDVGAGSSVGDWSSLKVADILTAILERRGPSAVALNLDRRGLARVMEGSGKRGPRPHEGGRLLSRLNMPPNVWVDIRVRDRREAASPPPGVDVLPPREAQAQALLRSRRALWEAHRAYVLAEVDVEALAGAARGLGFSRWSEVDRAVEEHERRLAVVRAEVDRAAARMRLAVETQEEESEAEEEPDPHRERLALLDLLANAAEAQGCTEADVLARLGKGRRDLAKADGPRLLALVSP